MKVKSFTKSLFYSVGTVFLLLAACFIIYQYHREKAYKIDVMHGRLQMYNYELMQSLDTMITDKEAFSDYVEHHNIEGLRVTVIDTRGRVMADNIQDSVGKMSNHLNREEVKTALKSGNGYAIKRTSETLSKPYFYSATYFPEEDIIVRASVPYDTKLANSLEADNKYIFYVVIITLLLGFVLYRNTRRVGRHIQYLRNFAMKAERGEHLDEDLLAMLPDDELGEISRTITVLYWKLKNSEEDKIRLKRQLTQNAAHELKTPAASIHGYLETLMRNPDIDESKKQHFIERCYSQSQRMSKLLIDMSTLTKLDDAITYDMNEDVDITSMISNLEDEFSLLFEDKGIRIVTNIPEGCKIKGNSNLTEGIFRNLMENALHYATGATELKIICFEDEDHYEFAVSDNGQGVERKHLPHLFERFYRVDKGRSRKLGGTGLGLAIVKNAVILHGGNARAEATPGGGLTIRLTLRKHQGTEK